jgi:hypothetical protein
MALLAGSVSLAASQETEVVAFEQTGQHTWEVPAGVEEVDVLVVGGGGGGGGRHGSGGGAGGLVFVPGFNATPGSEVSLKVGAGGAGGAGTESAGGKGGKCYFGELEALGGGGGFARNYLSEDSGEGGSGAGGAEKDVPVQGADGLQESLSGLSGTYGFGHDGGDGAADGSPYAHGGGGGAGEPGGDGEVSGDQSPGLGGDGIYRVTGNMGPYEKTYNFAEVYGTGYGEEINGNIYFAGGGGGGSHDPRPAEFKNDGGLGGGGSGGREPYSTNTDSGGLGDDGEDGMANTGGGGGGGSTDSGEGGGGGDGGSGIVLIRYETGPSICDRRGPLNECISNSSHSVSGQFFNISSVFQVEDTAVFEALNGMSTIKVENSTSLSGFWEGSFNISTLSAEKSVLRPGASFRPENGRIIIG